MKTTKTTTKTKKTASQKLIDEKLATAKIRGEATPEDLSGVDMTPADEQALPAEVLDRLAAESNAALEARGELTAETAAPAPVVSKSLRTKGSKDRTDRRKLSRFNQPRNCRMCGKLTTWSEVNGNSGLDLCGPCFNDANMENEHLDGHHAEIPGVDCKYCMAAAQKVAAQTTEELAAVVAEVEQAVKLAKGKKGKKAAVKTALVLVEQAKEALAPVAEVEPVSAVFASDGQTVLPAAPKAPKKTKAVKPAAAPVEAAPATLKLRLYAHGILYFGKAAAALLNGKPYLRITVDGLTLTLTPTKKAADALEVKYSHGAPQLSVTKLMAASGWSKATQDMAVTVDGDSFRVTAA